MAVERLALLHSNGRSCVSMSEHRWFILIKVYRSCPQFFTACTDRASATTKNCYESGYPLDMGKSCLITSFHTYTPHKKLIGHAHF